MNNDYYTRPVRIADFEVVRKEGGVVTLRGKYGIEMSVSEKCLFKDMRDVTIGSLCCTLDDYNWWLAGAWKWHYENKRKAYVSLFVDHAPIYVWAGDDILTHEELYNTLVPFDIWGVDDLRIGQLMDAWSYGLTAQCAYCGCEGKIYHFCGLPTSGSSVHSLFCSECGNFSEHVKGRMFTHFRQAILTAQHRHPATIVAHDALNIEELIQQILR